MQIIQAQLKVLGIDVRIQGLDLAALLKAGELNEFDALSLGWGGRIDPDGNVEPIFHSQGAFNYGKYSNPEVDQLIAQARQSTALPARKNLYQALQKKINDDVAYIFTYFAPTAFAAGAVVKGFSVTPDGLMRFKTVWADRI
jgi:peptide/nickel transport system substrate-binding protein